MPLFSRLLGRLLTLSMSRPLASRMDVGGGLTFPGSPGRWGMSLSSTYRLDTMTSYWPTDYCIVYHQFAELWMRFTASKQQRESVVTTLFALSMIGIRNSRRTPASRLRFWHTPTIWRPTPLGNF